MAMLRGAWWWRVDANGGRNRAMAERCARIFAREQQWRWSSSLRFHPDGKKRGRRMGGEQLALSCGADCCVVLVRCAVQQRREKRTVSRGTAARDCARVERR